MPSVAQKRRAQDSPDEELDDASSSHASTPSSVHKRPRVEHRNGAPSGGTNGTVDGSSDNEEEEEDGEQNIQSGGDDEDEDEDGDTVNGNILTLVDPAEDTEEELLGQEGIDIGPNTQPYQPGSIVRVKLKDFVTYTLVEVFPGPSLNMVIGPNGTGKSTIVCAICLGLGWGPVHLGRAKEVAEFVKHGCKEALIEIELQGREGEVNPIIKRKIIKENNKSEFWINKKLSSNAKVQALSRSYSIQIDNLCQFLPQDRVVEFAALSSIDLLRETQRAAAHPSVLENHENLKKLGRKFAEVSTDNSADKAQLATMENRQAALQQDVERLKERQETLKKIELMEKARPFVEYKVARNIAKAAKEESKKAERELRALREEEAPSLERVRAKKRYKDAIENGVHLKKKTIEKKKNNIKAQKDEKIPGINDQITDIQGKIKAEKTAERTRKDAIRSVKIKIEEKKAQLEKKPAEINLHEFNEKLSEKQKQIRELYSQANDMGGVIQPLAERGNHIQTQIAHAQRELKSLDSVSGLRERKLQSLSRDSWIAWDWYQKNKNDFEMEVYGPPVLTCAVTHPRYADVVENLLQKDQRLAFVCQTKNDYFKFLEACFGSKPRGVASILRLADVTIKMSSASPPPQPPIPLEEIKQLGFDGYAIDYLEGPPAVLNMICNEVRLHATPVSFRTFTAEQNQRIETTRLSTWIAGGSHYSIRRRQEYGASSTSVRAVRPGTIFSVQQVDQGLKRGLERRILELGADAEEIKQELETKNNERNTIRESHKRAQEEKRAIESEKSKQQQAWAAYNKIKGQIGPLEEDLKEKLEGGGMFKQNILDFEAELDNLTAQRARAALQFARMVSELIALYNDLIKLQLREVEANSDYEILDAKSHQTKKRLQDKKNEVEVLQKTATDAQRKAKRDYEYCKEIMSQLSQEESDFMNAISDERTSQDIDQDIEAERARLEYLHAGNPDAIRQYEERAAKITTLTQKIQKAERKIMDIENGIKEVRESWEPEVDTLVKKISHAFSKNFEKIGCAGEVRIHKDEQNYDKWAIEILVKFREKETLQILTNQRQSGGERAVSTVFYLMSLQSLARSPFRVVDEINQGMDPRNERLVHHRMVNIACQLHTSQYFLITPKLLPDLMYHPRMIIHCINSGDWIENESVMDYDRLLNAGRRLKAEAEASE